MARANARDFLGYGLIGREKARLKIASASLQRFRQRVKDELRRCRGTSAGKTIEALNPFLRGWTSFFRHAEVKDVWEDSDGVDQAQAAGPDMAPSQTLGHTSQTVDEAGTEEERAWRSATNGRGPWWNAGQAT